MIPACSPVFNPSALSLLPDKNPGRKPQMKGPAFRKNLGLRRIPKNHEKPQRIILDSFFSSGGPVYFADGFPDKPG